MTFLARIKEVSTKRTVDNEKTTKIVLYSEESIAAELDLFQGDENVKVTIVRE